MRMKVVCSGYIKNDGTFIECSKTIGWRSISKEQEKKYLEAGITQPVSHGMCPKCAAGFEKEAEELAKAWRRKKRARN